LITRVGDVNDQQLDFIKRVQARARNISELISSLLELERIESGFDKLKEYVPFGVNVIYAVDGIKSQIDEYQHRLTVEISENLPEIFGDPVLSKAGNRKPVNQCGSIYARRGRDYSPRESRKRSDCFPGSGYWLGHPSTRSGLYL